MCQLTVFESDLFLHNRETLKIFRFLESTNESSE